VFVVRIGKGRKELPIISIVAGVEMVIIRGVSWGSHRDEIWLGGLHEPL
jgi:hypothetical protein